MKHLLILLLFAALPALGEVDQAAPNVPEFSPAFPGQTRAQEAITGEIETEVFARGLAHPWGIAALPAGGYLVTERDGRMRIVGADGQMSAPLEGLPDIFVRAQGGLLDVALHPDFAQNRLVYFSYAKPMGLGRSALAVGRGVLSPDRVRLGDVRDIFVQQRASLSPAHFGSRLVFSADGSLFVTTGERFSSRALAQDTDTSYGKVLRIGADGVVLPDAPFDNAVWSYGHRNIQGAALDAAGQLWTVEHGPAGGDELNRIIRGANYGWPVISYGENYNGTSVGKGLTQAPGMKQPAYYWDPVIAPGGMLFYDGAMFKQWRGDIFIASLNPGGLVRLRLRQGRVIAEERFLRGTRIRDVQQAPDGALLVLVDDPNGAVWRITPK